MIRQAPQIEVTEDNIVLAMADLADMIEAHPNGAEYICEYDRLENELEALQKKTNRFAAIRARAQRITGQAAANP